MVTRGHFYKISKHYDTQSVYSSNTFKLKADRPHMCNYPQTPLDYRHTDNDLRLVMVVDPLAALGKAEPLILTTARHTFDLDP